VAVRKLRNQSPNNFDALKAELQPGEELVIGQTGNDQTSPAITSQAALEREAARVARHVTPRKLFFGAKS
jgi:hypothetical protein